MTKNKMVLFFFLFIIIAGGVALTTCARSTPQQISHYTCPMHPHIHEDKPGECPICHMKLVPVYKEEAMPNQSSIKGSSVNISPERQQLIGMQTTSVQKKPVSKLLRTVGRVAFDPELAIAQKEFVEITKNVPSLKKASRSRLLLLGMSEQEVRDLEKQGKISSALYLPEPGDSVWVYATLYQGEASLVKPGMDAEISLPSGSDQIFAGIVRSIDPVIDPVTRSARARIEVAKAGGILRPDTYVNALLKINLGEALVIPKSSVIDTGERQIAFVVHDDLYFESRHISIGSDAGNEVIVLHGLNEGEKVVSSAAFFVDSESQLKAAVSGSGSVPTCPEGETWDVGMAMCMPKIGK